MRNPTFLMFVLIWIPTLAVGVGVVGCLISAVWCEEAHHWSRRWLVPCSIGLGCLGALALLVGAVLRFV